MKVVCANGVSPSNPLSLPPSLFHLPPQGPFSPDPSLPPTPVMEPDMCMESGSMIRIAVLPVGGPIPPPALRNYIAMLTRHVRVDQSSISSFYTELQKSPFSHQPWDTGTLKFKYVIGGAPASPWEDFQSNRKILAVIGICHCPSSPDLDLVVEQFATACKGYGVALATRCFAFCPSDAQVSLDFKL